MKRSSRQLRQVWTYLDGTARRSCKTCNQAAAHNAFGQIDFTPGSGSAAAAPRSGSATAIARLWKTVRASATRSSMRQELHRRLFSHHRGRSKFPSLPPLWKTSQGESRRSTHGQRDTCRERTYYFNPYRVAGLPLSNTACISAPAAASKLRSNVSS